MKYEIKNWNIYKEGIIYKMLLYWAFSIFPKDKIIAYTTIWEKETIDLFPWDIVMKWNFNINDSKYNKKSISYS